METPDPPTDTPGASKQVVLTPHDIPRSLRVLLILLMAKIRRSPVEVGIFPIIYRVSYIPGGAGFKPSTVGGGS